MSFFTGNAAAFGTGLDRLLPSEEVSVPISTGGPESTSSQQGYVMGNTLDEPVLETFKRDALRIWKNLVMVVFPFKDRSQQSAALRNWDLWGPMVFTLALAVILSIGSAKASSTFSLVFALLSIGAIILTFNVILLGGSIGFFQSICLLGYCLFPLDVAALICLWIPISVIRWLVVSVAITWASWASVPFIGGAVPVNRRALAVFPLCLLYTTIGWLALVT